MSNIPNSDAISRCNALLKQFPIVLQGIVNVSPDSFSDGGLFCDPNAALAQALLLVNQGAHIIDVGGVSTRPGSQELETNEELKRLIPTLKLLRAHLPTSTLISADTSNPIVANEAAQEKLIDIINDVCSSQKYAVNEQQQFDSHNCDLKVTTAHVAARHNLGLILMHMQGNPATMQVKPNYANCVEEVFYFLEERMEFATKCGVKWLAIDPGIGFGKSLDHNLSLLSEEGLKKLSTLGAPLLIGLSRKSFIKAFAERTNSLPTFNSLDDEMMWRDQQSEVWEKSCIQFGARIIRTHAIKSYHRGNDEHS